VLRLGQYNTQIRERQSCAVNFKKNIYSMKIIRAVNKMQWLTLQKLTINSQLTTLKIQVLQTVLRTGQDNCY